VKTQLVLGFWTAKGFTDKLNEDLADLEAHGHEIIEVQYRTPVFAYTALIVYK